MLKGFHNLAAPDQGFQPGNVLTFAMTLPESKYRDNSQIVNYYNEVLRRLHDIRGLRSAAVINALPALADSRSSSIQIEGQPAASPDHPLLAELRVTSEDYFRAFSIPIQAGRSFSNYDTADGLLVAVISQSTAHRFFAGQDALGRRLKLTSRESNTPYLTVVVVVADVKHFLLSNEVRPTIYVPYTQQPVRSLEAVIESSAPLDRTANDARAAVRAVDSTLALPNIQRISRLFSDLVGAVGVIASLMAIFAVMAAILAAAGIYAVMSYSVAQRTREIGIRMALGARPQDVMKMIVSNALRLVSIGLVIGCLVAFALSRGMSSTLPGVVALDPLTFIAFALLLTAIALFASLIPSRRATKVDPLLALRSD
jgi:putative ABC transport system permease protein